MKEPEFVIEELDDPAETARHQAQRDRAERNSEWLQTHWAELLPGARGKFVAVAGQEAFIADTPEQARLLAEKAHPGDDGALCQFVYSHTGPRFYGHRRRMADL